MMTPDDSANERVLAVIIPAYDEQATIGTILSRVDALPCVREVIVVDDGSRDRTASIVESFDSPRVRLIRQPRNRGKTAAVRRAIEEVTSPITIIQDADLEYDPSEIPFVIAPILSGEADVVYGSRFLVRRAARVLYFLHYLANKLLTFCSNLLTNRNMTDIETCYKAFRTPILQQMPISSSGFGMEAEITALVSKTHARTYEVPISYYGRTYAEGKKIGVADGLHAFWYIFYYNLISRFTPKGRAYVRSVNQWLEEAAPKRGADVPGEHRGHPRTGDPAAPDQTGAPSEY
jgi:glycosyltransferase involved in cell wall biosynthesis